MMGTINCVYETPCVWCSKWDKKCDRKTPENKLAAVNKMCQSESDHEWECTGMSTAGTTYTCRKCYAQKTVPNVDQKYFSISQK